MDEKLFRSVYFSMLQKRGLDSASCKAYYKTEKCSSRQVHFSASQVARKIASCYSA